MLKRYATLFVSLCFVCLLISAGGAQASSAALALIAGNEKAAETVVIPSDATPEQVKDIMAGLSDEQVRALLLEELKDEAAAQKPKSPKETGLVGVVNGFKKKSAFIHKRFTYLFSSAATAPRELPKALRGVLAGSSQLSAGNLVLAIAFLSLLWVGAIFLFKKKTAQARKSIAGTPADSPWYTRMGRLFLRALLDLFGVVLVSAIVFVCYLTLFSQGAGGKPVIIAWLTAIIFLALVKIVSRFLLAPHAPTLRYLPLSDEVAQYLFKWTVWIARIMATGLLLNTLITLEGGSEALSLLVTTFFGFLVAFTLVLLALWNKKPVADYIRQCHKPGTLIYQFADSWHMGAIAYFFGAWMFWVLALMVFGGKALLAGVLTLLIIPMYFLFDWATQRLVRFAVDMAESDAPEKDKSADDADDAEGPTITRFQNFLKKGFRILIFAATVFVLLRIWGMDFTFGRETVRAAIDTLLTLVLAYIFWVFITGVIDRKLREKQGDGGGHGDGEGGGGPGGDRFSTLLQLVKKFIFAAITVVTVLIILSSMGVDIGPLIAGASVFGIAIGFGAQTLVKDIISGIFFLMDDAFRVGDYIIVGSARGSVEAISVRSFKLRHHLGSLFTIPFGSVKNIQNMTRDWAIMKLQYLVPFDTDIAQVKNIIKKINKEIRSHPELNEFMLDDIKSQGVKAMEEYGMRMRVKFMTKPGGQFTLRKLVLAKMRKEFAEAGIEFAKPRVSVHMPGDTVLTPEEQAQVSAAASKIVEDKAKAKAAKPE